MPTDEPSRRQSQHNHASDMVFAAKQHPTQPLGFYTDTDHEALEALRHVSDLLPGVLRETYAWKWVLIALHNAVQAYMVLALSYPWPPPAYRRSQVKLLIAARRDELANLSGRAIDPPDHGDRNDLCDKCPYRRPKRAPELDEIKLNVFLELYEDIQSPTQMVLEEEHRPFVAGRTHDASMKELNEVRNALIHFVPGAYLDYIGTFPTVVQDALDIIEFLTFESGKVPWRHEPQFLRRTSELLEGVRSELATIVRAYGLNASEPR